MSERIRVTGFAATLTSVDEIDGQWRILDGDGNEFQLTGAEVRDVLPVLEAVVEELDLREEA